jgi:nucleotide-binding universal stress UspA family protein
VYKRILVPVDGTDCSEAALRHAIALAREQAAEVRLVCVVDESAIDVQSPAQLKAWDALVAAAKAALEKARASAARAGVAADARLVEMEGVGERIGELIVREARSWPADLIAMGTHGRRGLSHLVLGSVAEGVLRGSDVPVLLVHAARKA